MSNMEIETEIELALLQIRNTGLDKEIFGNVPHGKNSMTDLWIMVIGYLAIGIWLLFFMRD